jgi:hypothetical protein
MIKDEKRFVDRDNSIMFASRVVASLSDRSYGNEIYRCPVWTVTEGTSANLLRHTR